MTTPAEYTTRVVEDVVYERGSQNKKWGTQRHPDGTEERFVPLAEEAKTFCDEAFKDGTGTWRHILQEEVAEAFAESDPVKLRAELVQVAAVAVAWVEAIDRREVKP